MLNLGFPGDFHDDVGDEEEENEDVTDQKRSEKPVIEELDLYGVDDEEEVVFVLFNLLLM